MNETLKRLIFILKMKYKNIFEDWKFTFFERLLFHYFGIRNERIIKLKNGMKFKVRNFSTDIPIIIEILFEKVYTKDFPIPKNSVVVDIGAHIGVFSILASKTAKKVYSFEPVPNNFITLLSNIKLNSCNNVKAFNMAVDKSSSLKKISLNNDDTSGHSFYSKGSESIEVRAISLEDIFKANKIEKIDFLKIDCEGSEYDILFHTPRKYLDRIAMISMETHMTPRNSTHDIVKFLSDNGFKADLKSFNKKTGRGLIYAAKIKK